MRTASLPMYNLPEMRAHNQAFWRQLATHLIAAGVPGVPPGLESDRAPVPDSIGPEILFTQTCGYPLQTIYRGQHTLLGIPEYDAPGCDGPTHCAFILVREDDKATSLEALRGRVFACNSIHSNSGMNLPRRTLAPLAAGQPFFSKMVFTGSHGASMELVRAGGADAASIDNLTYVFHQDFRPAALAGLRILAQTVPSPAIPFITAAATDPATVAALRQALAQAAPSAPPALRLRAIHPPESADYAVLLRYAAEAEALGCPALA